jgi:hypothetical protein
MQTFVLYCKAVGRHWWALMSCALFTVLGIYILHANKSNEWAVKATFALAGLCLLIACFQAWLCEHQKVEAADSEVVSLKKTYFDARPRVALTVRSPQTDEEWRSLENIIPPPIFRLEHYAGRTARFVTIDPCYSSLGKFRIEFDEISILGAMGGRQVHTPTFTVFENNQPDLSHDPRILKIMRGIDSLLNFFRDHSPDEKESEYLVMVRYRDHDDVTEYAETFILKCEYPKFLLSLYPKPPH